MPIPELSVGDTWAAVTVKSISDIEERESDQGMGVYDYFKDRRVTLQCRCGNKWKVWLKEWKGKRAVQDCGECNSSGSEEKTTLTVRIPVSHVIEIKREAYNLNASVNQYVQNLLQLGRKAFNDLGKDEPGEGLDGTSGT